MRDPRPGGLPKNGMVMFPTITQPHRGVCLEGKASKMSAIGLAIGPRADCLTVAHGADFCIPTNFRRNRRVASVNNTGFLTRRVF
eukprot:5446113-Alexandrium_andersonii.AAC.1